jgi:hypothetical protein
MPPLKSTPIWDGWGRGEGLKIAEIARHRVIGEAKPSEIQSLLFLFGLGLFGFVWRGLFVIVWLGQQFELYGA